VGFEPKGKTYCFSSADAKSQFMKNPSGNLTTIRVSIRLDGDSSVENLALGVVSTKDLTSWRDGLLPK
jgi:hypothetical protein